jgi:molybdate transport system substrate-binding protein
MIKFLFAFFMVVAFSTSAPAGEMTLAAGAGLKDVLNDIGSTFSQRNQSVKIVKNFVVSGVLAKQLDNGAQMDVVFTANTEWMDYLKEKKHVDLSTITPFA